MKKKILSVILICLITVLASFTMTACGGEKICKHEFSGDGCVKCGASTPSEGLEFELSNDGGYYVVKSIGECMDTELVIPGTYNNLPVKVIGAQAFKGNLDIVSVEIHDGITNINPYAFTGCENLESVDFPKTLEVIDWCSFKNCVSLKEIDVPSKVYQIEYGAFMNCSNLCKVALGNKVNTIGTYAFSHCMNLTSITLPASVKNFGDKIFFNCYKLVEVCNLSKHKIEAGSTSFGYIAFYAKEVIKKANQSKIVVDANGFVFYNDTTPVLLGNEKDMTGVSFPASFNGNKYEIYDYAFQKRDDIEVVELPSSVVKIGKSAFNSCFNLSSFDTGEGVTDIEESAFFMCSNLSQMKLGSKISKIGDNAFRNSLMLSLFTYNGTSSQWASVQRGDSWNLLTGIRTVKCTDLDVDI